MIRITTDRLQKLVTAINGYLLLQMLKPGQALRLYGQIGWTCMTLHGRSGRAKLRPIMQQAREDNVNTDVQLQSALLWWKCFLTDYRPRSFERDVRHARHVIGDSLGEGSAGGVGAALRYAEGMPPLASFLKVPTPIRKLLRK